LRSSAASCAIFITKLTPDLLPRKCTGHPPVGWSQWLHGDHRVTLNRSQPMEHILNTILNHRNSRHEKSQF
jgi:hypothetical protein